MPRLHPIWRRAPLTDETGAPMTTPTGPERGDLQPNSCHSHGLRPTSQWSKLHQTSHPVRRPRSLLNPSQRAKRSRERPNAGSCMPPQKVLLRYSMLNTTKSPASRPILATSTIQGAVANGKSYHCQNWDNPDYPDNSSNLYGYTCTNLC